MGYYDRNERWYEHKDYMGNKYYDHNPLESDIPTTKFGAYTLMVISYTIAFFLGQMLGEGFIKDGYKDLSLLWVEIGLAIGVGLFGRMICNEAFNSHLETTKAAIICAVIMAIILTILCVVGSLTLTIFPYLILFLFAICV